MALTVFCPQKDKHGPCQTPIKCSGQMMCAHLRAMLDEAKKQEASQFDIGESQ